MNAVAKKIEILEGIKNVYNNMLKDSPHKKKSVVRKWIYEIEMKIVAQQAIISNRNDTVCLSNS
ncbi:hypothetical protein WAF17_02605 [Bernardetia sp. ABR2-2B]|uniref:hypothetical protein n=1 Tax=Bernardetia sp. ABR2-2B TaxID=3127472 RepID=UPI0030CBC1EB